MTRKGGFQRRQKYAFPRQRKRWGGERKEMIERKSGAIADDKFNFNLERESEPRKHGEMSDARKAQFQQAAMADRETERRMESFSL